MQEVDLARSLRVVQGRGCGSAPDRRERDNHSADWPLLLLDSGIKRPRIKPRAQRHGGCVRPPTDKQSTQYSEAAAEGSEKLHSQPCVSQKPDV